MAYERPRFAAGDGRSNPLLKPARTSARPETGRMLESWRAVFTMGPWLKLSRFEKGGKDLASRGLGLRLPCTVKSLYEGVNNRDNLFLSCCCF